MPLQPAEVRIDKRIIDFHYDRKKHITEFNIPDEKVPEIYYNLLGKWNVKEENLELADGSSWLDWQPWKGLENYDFLKNGYAFYRTDFEISEVRKPLYLILTGFQDEVSLYLNGQEGPG